MRPFTPSSTAHGKKRGAIDVAQGVDRDAELV
jgi:hypothetical protein